MADVSIILNLFFIFVFFVFPLLLFVRLSELLMVKSAVELHLTTSSYSQSKASQPQQRP